jgi:hypothetical protein
MGRRGRFWGEQGGLAIAFPCQLALGCSALTASLPGRAKFIPGSLCTHEQ